MIGHCEHIETSGFGALCEINPRFAIWLGRCLNAKTEWLDGELGAQTTSLCGRNAVQIAHAKPIKLDFEFLTKNLIHLGNVSSTRFLLRFSAEDCDFTVFPDGRAIIKGTDEPDRAMALYARYIGH